LSQTPTGAASFAGTAVVVSSPVKDSTTTAASVDLLRRAREGSRSALGALLDACAPRLLALIRLRLGPRLRAELESRDVLQATLLKALTRFEDFSGPDRGSLAAWLARIAENEIRDLADFHTRQRRDVARRVSLDHESGAWRVAADLRSATSRIALDEELLRLERALESLTTEQREVIVLRRLHELEFGEIGERMGRSPDACRMLLTRSLAALTLAFEERL
jgi:RNA polymerase sigma-70 factor, ECF subfamily